MQNRTDLTQLWGYPIDLIIVIGFWVAYSAAQDQPLTLVVLLPIIFPFWLALTMAWLVVRRGERALHLGHALTVWLFTLVGGMVLRNLSGPPTAAPLIVVATMVLTFGLLGWRLIGFLILRTRQTHRAAARGTARDRLQ